MIKALLTHSDNILNLSLLLTLLFVVISVSFQFGKKEKISLSFLLIAGFFLYCFAALLDQYLNIWDERFHALVAKNLMNHPFKPTLYEDPVVNMSYDRWDRFYIWLHKQPLFLWQIALSFKIFGISEFSLRIPSILSGVILVFAGFRMGKLLVNSRTGYLTGVSIISTYYIFELISGRQAVDHNDLSFLFYVSLSIWSFIEYYYSKNKLWIVLIGLFSGFAILCKWLVGLLVYFGWFLLKLLQKNFKIIMFKDLLISLTITILIAAPWQIYTFIVYPVEAAKAYGFNLLHFKKALDGHSGTIWFYFENLNTNYGRMATILIIPALIVLFKIINDKKLFFSLAGMVIIVYIFFSTAATKMLSFPTVVILIFMVGFGSLFDYIISFIANLKVNKLIKSFLYLSLFILIIFRFHFDLLKERHMEWDTENTYSHMLTHNREILNSLVIPENAVLFNVYGIHFIEAMFYTGKSAYNFIPSEEQYLDLKSKGRNICIFRNTNTEIPDYLKNDSCVIYINEELLGYK